MRYFLFALMMCLSLPVMAQVTGDDAAERLALSQELHKIKPTKPQVDRAIENVARQLTDSQQRVFAATIKRVLSYPAIEQASINAMADVFTKEELETMLEYHKKPAAQSAAAKQEQYQSQVSPEITRMLDRALMEMRTGGAAR